MSRVHLVPLPNNSSSVSYVAEIIGAFDFIHTFVIIFIITCRTCPKTTIRKQTIQPTKFLDKPCVSWKNMC